MLGPEDHYDVVIIGAGLAGLSLARQLSLKCNKKILLLEKRATVPPRKQKVGESLVQLGGYYFSKVLDMEEHLLRRHFEWSFDLSAIDRFPPGGAGGCGNDPGRPGGGINHGGLRSLPRMRI